MSHRAENCARIRRGEKRCKCDCNGSEKIGTRKENGGSRGQRNTVLPSFLRKQQASFQRYLARDLTLRVSSAKQECARERHRSVSFCPSSRPYPPRRIRLRIVSSRSLILSTGFKRMEHSLVEATSTVSARNGLPMPD